ncbi:cytochrome P450 [Actinoplanes sp. NPDC051470]|uniref:cytochrome P450 n=1 Tax=Actinoplanes sp. NPDC051470 TaxID=3157224 RepID=UPI003442F7A8
MTNPESIIDARPAPARAPIHLTRGPAGPEFWLVTRYHEAHAALDDQRLRPLTDPPAPVDPPPDAHAEEIVAHLLDGLAARGRGDLVPDVAVPLAHELITTPPRPVIDVVGTAMITLFRHPAQTAALRARPTLLPAAVEELIRFDGPVPRTAPAVAVEELTIGGKVISAGDHVVVSLAAANRDPRRFPDPDRLDLMRADDGHLGLGYGRRLSPVAAHVRLAARVAIGGLLTRFPGLRLAILPEDLAWLPQSEVRGVSSLPVTTG